jgi:dienelactone hydrolase
MLGAIVLAASLWGNLEAGPHAAGYAQLARYDASRPYRTARTLDGTPRKGERARPIVISVWYPASVAPDAKPLTFGDYVDFVANEAGIAPMTEERRRRAEATLFALPLLNTATAEQRAKLRPMQTRAYRNAKPASGTFPLILYSLGSAALAHVTPEYLASHGYVVVQSPRLGPHAGSPPDNRDGLDLEMKLRDMDFILNVVRNELPQADVHNIGTLGFSAGGRWALAAAMKNPDVHAVVSLDSVMLFNDPVTEAWRRMPHFSLDAVRAPVLHITRETFARQDDPAMWTAMRHADRTRAVFDDPALDHFDFQSIGYALALAGVRDSAKFSGVFHAFNRATLAFFNAHLKGGSFALESQPGMSVARVAAQPAPITAAEFANALEEEGVDGAIAAYRRAWKERGEPPVPEATLNVSGYTALFGGRVADGVKLLALNAEAFPNSANVYDSLADAYLAAGDRAKAVEYAKKADALLAQDTTIAADRKAAIKASIDAKLKR